MTQKGIIMENTSDDVAIACTLTDAEIRDRRALARKTVLPEITKHKRTSNGLTLSFAETPKTRAIVEEFADLEKGCCGFLTFDLDPVQAQTNDPFKLVITGPEGSGKFIDKFVRLIEDMEAGTDAQNAA